MISLKYENQGTNSFLVYQLKEEDVIDTLSMGMITNNKIYGFLPFFYFQKDSEKLFKYNISSKISLKQFFAGVVNKKRLLSVFSSISTAIIGAEEYMIDANMFILNTEYIYVDVSTCEVSLVCLPIVQASESIVEMGKFFKDIIFTVQFDQTENCDYVAKIISFLNSNVNFSIGDFKTMINSLIGGNPSSTQPKVEVNNTPELKVPVQNSVESNIATAQPMAQIPVGQPVGQIPQPITNTNTVKATPISPNTNITLPNNANSNQNIMPQPINNTKKEKKKGWLFGKKDKNKEKSTVAAQPSSFAIPGKKETITPVVANNQKTMGLNAQPTPQPQLQPSAPINQQTNIQPNIQPNMKANMQPNMQPNMQFNIQPNLQPAFQQGFNTNPQINVQQSSPINFGETTLLSTETAGETTVLSANNVNMKVEPYLIRIKTGERININKALFRLGKERTYVDYFVSNNTAISRTHADIITRDGEYFIRDNNSTNGTFLNGNRITSNQDEKIKHDDKIMLANEVFQFKLY
ncbi:MAG: FHA domain-containing protein [Bacteroidales bacterium]|nr:FHA domain-containing protein [Bacteroidales bacterium]